MLSVFLGALIVMIVSLVWYANFVKPEAPSTVHLAMLRIAMVALAAILTISGVKVAKIDTQLMGLLTCAEETC